MNNNDDRTVCRICKSKLIEHTELQLHQSNLQSFDIKLLGISTAATMR
jgi:hypothetical protein